jgi:hypothetical protein
MTHCFKCSGEVHELDVQICTVTEDEAREHRASGVRAGDVVCAACFHILMFPTLDKNRDELDDPGTDFERYG